MEPYYAGWLSLLPPIIAITLALVRKEVYSSLFIGILSGAFIYSIGTGANPIMGTIGISFDMIAKKIDFEIIMFGSLLGALVYIINMAGAAKAYGNWAKTKIDNRRKAMLSTCGLGAFLFVDDYFNCLTIGTVMKPVTDNFKISRAKLAYIIDATAAPICIIAPISSWAAAVGSNLKATGAFTNEFAAFISTVPYNFYAVLSLLTVIILCYFDFDFGPMKKAEIRAQEGDLGAIDKRNDKDEFTPNGKSRVSDMLIPLTCLIVFAAFGLLYTGGYFGSDPKFHTVSAALGNCATAKALVWASFGALLVELFLVVPRGLMTFNQFMDGFVEGVKIMLPAIFVLVLAWGISGICRDLLQTPKYVESVVSAGAFMAWILPAVIFVLAGFLSFATGTSWGTFGILIPIVVPVAQALDPQILIVSLSAVLAGSVFGDHCSPISDTTILSSAGAGCLHIDHVSTQLVYTLIVAGCSIFGYIVCGLTHGSLVAGLGSAVTSLLIVLFVLKKGISLK